MLKINFAKVEEIQGTVVETEEVTNTTTIEGEIEMINTTTEVIVEVTMAEVREMKFNAVRALAKQLNVSAGGKREDIEARIAGKLGEVEIAEVRGVPCATCQKEVSMVDQHGDCDLCASERDAHFNPGSAAGESPVAEQTKAKDDVAMNEAVEKELMEIAKRNNQKMLDSWADRTENVRIKTTTHKYENPMLNDVRKAGMGAAQRYMATLGEYPVTVVGIEFFATPDLYNRVGKVHLLIEPEYMEIGIWDRVEKKVMQYDFADFQLDQFRRSFIPPAGNGLLTLAIKENADGLYVRLPKYKRKNGEGYGDILSTRNIKWKKAHSDNNANFEAAVSAFVRVFSGEHVQQHPANRFGFDESCMNCRHIEFFQVKNGVDDDLHADDELSTVILEQADIPELAQYGAMKPQAYCTVYNRYVDQEIVEEVNLADQSEKDYYYDEDGNMHWLGQNEVLIAGRAFKKSEARREGTKKICGGCSFYHKNEYKGESRIAAERTQQREAGIEKPFVNSYYTERARIERQVVQTLVEGVWITKYPGQVANPESIRIKGLGGVTVYGSDELMAHADPTFVTPDEEFKVEVAEIEGKIRQIFYAAFNLGKLDKEQADSVFALALNKPSDLDDRYSKKWDNAVHWLSQSLEWAKEKKAASERLPFIVKFNTQMEEGDIEINAEDFMTETKHRETYGLLSYGMGYEDLMAHEFTRFLDEEVATETIYDVLYDGLSFVVVAEDALDAELVAGGLQTLLQRQLNNLIYGVRRSEDRAEAIAKMNVCDEIKTYIAACVQLQK